MKTESGIFWTEYNRRGAATDRRAVGRMLVEHLRFLQSVIDSVTDPIPSW